MQSSQIDPVLDPVLDSVRSRGSTAPTKAFDVAKHQWLCWLHEMLPDVTQLMLFRVSANKRFEICTHNPGAKPSSAGAYVPAAYSESVSNAVLSTVHRNSAVYMAEGGTKSQHILSIPFKVVHDGTAVVADDVAADVTAGVTTEASPDAINRKSGSEQSIEESYVLVMLCSALSSIQQKTALKLTLWAATQLKKETQAPLPLGSSHSVTPAVQLSHALVDAQNRYGTFNAMAVTLVNTLANLCGCVRVSLGCHDGSELQLLAMSGQSQVDARRKVSRQLHGLMIDTIECERAVYPNEMNASPTVQAYFRSQGEHPLFMFLLPGSLAEKYVLVLERADGSVFNPTQANAIERSVQSVASLLELSRARELPARVRVKRKIKSVVNKIRLVKHWSKKQWLIATAVSVLLLSFIIPVNHRVAADAFIEASDRQVLVAAQDGFILAAYARAGEEVKAGDLLAKIDGQDLQLGLDKWLSEKSKNQQEYTRALAAHDRSELSRLRADEKRIDAEIALFEQQLHRSEVRSPFDGVLLNGDWSQSLGAPVKTGDVLFEVASAEQYRLVLQVDEHDIAYIEPSQQAQLRMAALPASNWTASLGDVMPVAISEKGSSAFRIPATIEGEAGALRPGMEGVGKVTIGRRSMFWVYTHKLVDKLRYVAWKVGLL